MSKNIIVVQNVFENPDLTVNSIESIRNAAKRWGADFYELNTIQFPDSPNPFFWDRIWEYLNFSSYEKVLIVDPDVVINIKAPSVFEELNPDFDFCVVKDGNPGKRFENPVYLRDSIVKHNAMAGNTIEVFQKNIPGFSAEKYWDNYFNVGVNLFYPERIKSSVEKMRDLIFNNSEIYQYVNFEGGGIWFSPQNLINAIFSCDGIKIKFLGNEWNWVAPDIAEEYHENFFFGPMKPWIYHFTGTNGSKESLIEYNRWK
jgi:hypothetical protein